MNRCCDYKQINLFGRSLRNTEANPLSYCAVSGLDSGFSHTIGNGSALLGPNSSQCQTFMGQYCANKWDDICEYMSNDNQTGAFPNTVQNCNGASGSCLGPGTGSALTKGQVLIRNAMAERFLIGMSSNCRREYFPFDPTVADSPLISKWVPSGGNMAGCGSTLNCNQSNACIPIYGVDPRTIDNDPIMNKVLTQPWIAMDILVNIYNNAVRTHQIMALRGTKIYKLFSTPQFQLLAKTNIYS